MEKKLGKRHILFGFEAGPLRDKIKGQLASNGLECTTIEKYSKSNVRQYLLTHPDIDTVILVEAKKNEVWSARELAELTDELDTINVIVIVRGEHRGTDYVRTLYAAGITSAVFQETSNKGISWKELIPLIVKKRSRRIARRIYDIEQIEINTEDQNETKIGTCLSIVRDEKLYGGSLGERLLQAINHGHLTALQTKQLLERIPKSYLLRLITTEEYKAVNRALKSIEKQNTSSTTEIRTVYIESSEKDAQHTSTKEIKKDIRKSREDVDIPKDTVVTPPKRQIRGSTMSYGRKANDNKKKPNTAPVSKSVDTVVKVNNNKDVSERSMVSINNTIKKPKYKNNGVKSKKNKGIFALFRKETKSAGA